MNRYDIAVVGSGPAGLAAAVEARALGLATLLLDEQAAPGGQIYNSVERSPLRETPVLGPDYAAGLDLTRRLRACGADHVTGASVWYVDPQGALAYSAQGRAHQVQADRIILATGALERPVPIPGWTLPGVMTAGAAQVTLKSAGSAAPDAVFAGSGPLLYLIAAQYIRAGVPIRALLDTTAFGNYARAALMAAAALRGAPVLLKGLGLLREIARAGVPVIRGVDAVQAQGSGRLQAVAYRRRGLWTLLDGVDALFLHEGVVPNLHLALSAGCERVWDDRQLAWRPRADAAGRTTQPAILVAGDGAGIAGAGAAPLSGRLAALAAGLDLGRIDAGDHRRESARVLADLARETAVRPFLDTLYRPRLAIRAPDGDVLVCRCEEVSARTVRAFVRAGGLDPNQLKSERRCGMGPCQGRMCGLTVTEIVAQERGVAPAAVGGFRARPPAKPVPLEELASLADADAA